MKSPPRIIVCGAVISLSNNNFELDLAAFLHDVSLFDKQKEIH